MKTSGKYNDVSEVLARVQDTVPFLGIELRDVNQRSIFNDTPLILVMTWGDIEAATLLIEGGADVGAQGENGDTALHRAASFASTELVAMLLANRAPTLVKNDDGDTPLDSAKLRKNQAVVRMLGG